MIEEYPDLDIDELIPIVMKDLGISKESARLAIEIERGIIKSDLFTVDKNGDDISLPPGEILE